MKQTDNEMKAKATDLCSYVCISQYLPIDLLLNMNLDLTEHRHGIGTTYPNPGREIKARNVDVKITYTRMIVQLRE